MTALQLTFYSLPFYIMMCLVSIFQSATSRDILQAKFGDQVRPKREFYTLLTLMMFVAFFDLQRFLCALPVWQNETAWVIWLMTSLLTPCLVSWSLEWLLLRPESTKYYEEVRKWNAEHPCDP